jgi:8-oxo-dGTP pyrophosphatase MutT (NUDIX family)
MAKVGKDYVCAFENVTDLKPQLKQFLEPAKKGNLYIYHDSQESLFKTFSKCFKNIAAGGGLVRNSDGDLLVIFRRGKWDLPKGKNEPGETIEQTALREVEEECSLEGLKMGKFLRSTYHIYEEAGKYILKTTDWFSMSYSGKSAPRPMLSEDITEVRWISSSGMDEVYRNTYPSIIGLIKESF